MTSFHLPVFFNIADQVGLKFYNLRPFPGETWKAEKVTDDVPVDQEVNPPPRPGQLGTSMACCNASIFPLTTGVPGPFNPQDSRGNCGLRHLVAGAGIPRWLWVGTKTAQHQAPQHADCKWILPTSVIVNRIVACPIKGIMVKTRLFTLHVL